MSADSTTGFPAIGRWTGQAELHRGDASAGRIQLTFDISADSRCNVQGLVSANLAGGVVEGIFSRATLFPQERKFLDHWYEAYYSSTKYERAYRVGVEAAIADSGMVSGYVKSGYTSESVTFLFRPERRL